MHGAGELFEDSGDQDITYDLSSVERLLDRSSGVDKTAETQFSFARVWANNQGTLQDGMVEEEEDQQALDPGAWAKILKERERNAAEEAAAKADAYGRGRRARGNVDYNNDQAPDGVEGMDITPLKRDELRPETRAILTSRLTRVARTKSKKMVSLKLLFLRRMILVW